VDAHAVARRALGLIDLTDLSDPRGSSTPAAIDELCSRATGPAGRGPTAAVCIWPEYVAQAAAALADSPVRVATVVNFPAGGEDVDAVVQETEGALLAGADEIERMYKCSTKVIPQSSEY
jgi:deoxyribose-phosphate aldolase